MRKNTSNRYELLRSKYNGYICTRELLNEGFSNRQIFCLQEDGLLEKISNGYFWLSGFGKKKHKKYKAIEVCFVNKNAVIVADSACFYHGFIDVEPKKLSIGTRRNDRRLMTFPFPVTRHYLAQSNYEERMTSMNTKFGSFNIYDLDRSIWDCIRFYKSIDPKIFEMIIEKYKTQRMNDEIWEQMIAYAKEMKCMKEMRRVFTI